MTIGIVGLLPDQTHHIERKFKDLDLKFLPKEQDRNVKAFAQGCSTVILMGNFIGHSQSDGVPKHKQKVIHGGMSALQRYLQTIPAPVRTVVAKPAREVIDVPLDKDGKVSYKILNDAQPGDIYRFQRPKGIDQTTWESRVTSTRSNYGSTRKLKTRAKFEQNFVEIEVLTRNGNKKRDEDLQREQQAQATQPAATPVYVPLEGESQLWREVYVARMYGVDATDEMCTEAADKAVALFRERYAH